MQSRISNDQKKTPPPKRGEWDGGGAGKRLLMIPGKLLVRLGVAAVGLISIRLPWSPSIYFLAFPFSASLRHVSTTVSGLSDMV